jgi:MFS family permease
VLTRIYGTDVKTTYHSNISALAFAGTIVGMLGFGYISDKIGRKTGMMSATAIVAFFSLLSAASAGRGVGGLFAMLTVCRFFL